MHYEYLLLSNIHLYFVGLLYLCEKYIYTYICIHIHTAKLSFLNLCVFLHLFDNIVDITATKHDDLHWLILILVSYFLLFATSDK